MQNNCFRKCSVRVPVCINNHDKLFQMQCFFMQHLETHQMRIINFLIHYIPFLKDLIRAKNLLPLFSWHKNGTFIPCDPPPHLPWAKIMLSSLCPQPPPSWCLASSPLGTSGTISIIVIGHIVFFLFIGREPTS